MNILVIGDDHGSKVFEQVYELAVKRFGQIDVVIHTGDSEMNELKGDYYWNICKCPLYMVRGNCDFDNKPIELRIEIGNKKFFVTHGHKYNVYYDMQSLVYAGGDADYIIFGHTHRACEIGMKNATILNPGSLTKPRGSKYGSFAVVSENDGVWKNSFIDFIQE